MKTKTCRSCKKVLPSFNFGKDRGRPDGINIYCKSCLVQKRKQKKPSLYKRIPVDEIIGEVWKDIAGYDGVYRVSNLGRVVSSISFH